MSEERISGVCQWCSGTGTNVESVDENGNPQTVPCTKCGATGRIFSSVTIDSSEEMRMLEKIDKTLKKIMAKLDINE